MAYLALGFPAEDPLIEAPTTTTPESETAETAAEEEN